VFVALVAVVTTGVATAAGVATEVGASGTTTVVVVCAQPVIIDAANAAATASSSVRPGAGDVVAHRRPTDLE
jgi:hypothetical protein